MTFLVSIENNPENALLTAKIIMTRRFEKEIIPRENYRLSVNESILLLTQEIESRFALSLPRSIAISEYGEVFLRKQ